MLHCLIFGHDPGIHLTAAFRDKGDGSVVWLWVLACPRCHTLILQRP